MIETIFRHRSVRSYKSDPVDERLLERILKAGVRASNTGNMQVYSIVVTTDPAIRQELSPCHFGQPMVTGAPVVLTFCVDVRRFSLWCRQRGAEPGYDNFVWFLSGAIDADAGGAEHLSGRRVGRVGRLLSGHDDLQCRPDRRSAAPARRRAAVTTVTLGWPEEMPPLTDRLPLEGVVHRERYEDYTPETIDRIWAEREASPETAELLRANGLPNLARIFTERRYTAEDNRLFSRKYFDMLEKAGLFQPIGSGCPPQRAFPGRVRDGRTGGGPQTDKTRLLMERIIQKASELRNVARPLRSLRSTERGSRVPFR